VPGQPAIIAAVPRSFPVLPGFRVCQQKLQLDGQHAERGFQVPQLLGEAQLPCAVGYDEGMDENPYTSPEATDRQPSRTSNRPLHVQVCAGLFLGGIGCVVLGALSELLALLCALSGEMEPGFFVMFGGYIAVAGVVLALLTGGLFLAGGWLRYYQRR
jgi:hypothetical protein